MSKNEDRIIREKERAKITGISRSTWQRWEKEGIAPKRKILGPNASGWLLSDIHKWIGHLPLKEYPE